MKLMSTTSSLLAATCLSLGLSSAIQANEKNASPAPLVIAAELRSTPNDLLVLLNKFITERDIESIMALHASGAAMVKWGGGVARGEAEIRQIYEEFFATKPILKVSPRQITEAGGDAIILGDYTLEYTNANGKIVKVGGRFGDIVRQQPDGSWLYLLDNPYAP